MLIVIDFLFYGFSVIINYDMNLNKILCSGWFYKKCMCLQIQYHCCSVINISILAKEKQIFYT